MATPVVNLSIRTLLSQVLVAFTIKFDNEFEHLTPHRTTMLGASSANGGGPWLASMVMYSNFLRGVGESETTVEEVGRVVRLPHLPLAGMTRWGYVRVNGDGRVPGGKEPRPDWVIHITSKGRKAQKTWASLFDVIEKRWCTRFGTEQIDTLRLSLWGVTRQLEMELPEYHPIVGYGLSTPHVHYERRSPRPAEDAAQSTIPALLSQLLLAFTLEFERESKVSLAICANILRVLNESGVPNRELPGLSGVSKEGIAMATGFLSKGGWIEIESDQTIKMVKLTAKGAAEVGSYHKLLATLERGWQDRFGADAIHNLRTSLEGFAGDGTPQHSPLFQCIEPYPDGWRAKVRKPETLPHYPMVLHRGGYPDGS